MPASGSLLVLHDAEDLACVEASCPEALSGDVLAFDADIHLILQRRGLIHLTPWDVVGGGELPQLVAYEAAIRRHWTTHAQIEFEGINLLNMAAYRHISALARLAWAAYALGRALDHVRPAMVYTFDEPPAHGLDRPADCRKMPLLFGVLRGLAERRGLRVRLLPRGAHAPLKSDPLASGAVTQVSRTPTYDGNRTGNLDALTYPPINPEAEIRNRPYVLFHGNRTDVMRQLPLIRAIRQQTDWQVVQLYKTADVETVRQAERCGHLFWHESQVAVADPPPSIAPSARTARLAFDSAGRAASEDLRALFDNPHTASHFDFLFGDYARKMTEHIRTWTSFFAHCRPAAFVANYHAPIYDIAAEVGIPCLGLAHGLSMIGQPEWFASLPESSLIGALSELHRSKLTEAGVAEQRIRITGDPWADQITNEGRARRSAAGDARMLRERVGITPHRRIVLLCTGSFGMPSTNTTLPLVDWADAVRSMKDLGELARRRGNWTFVVKCHPRFDYPSLYADINRTLPADRRLIVLPEEPLGPLVQAADAVCVWNTPTSALVEASLLDKPVLMFSRSMVWYDRHKWGTDAWPHARDLDAFEAELEALFFSSSYYKKRVQQTLAAARRFLGDTHGRAIPRCLNVLREITSTPVEAG